MCVCPDWLVVKPWGEVQGAVEKKQLRQDETWSHLHFLSHIQINSLSEYSPPDIRYFRQLSQDLAEHLSFFLISPLLCHSISLSRLKLPLYFLFSLFITSTLSWLFPLFFYTRLIPDKTVPFKINLLSLSRFRLLSSLFRVHALLRAYFSL